MNDEALLTDIRHVAGKVAGKYRGYATVEDLTQELAVYAYGGGRKALEKWQESGEQFRVMRALFGAAKRYCEQEKAVAEGYDLTDLAWYTPDKLRDLLLLALDPQREGLDSGDGEAHVEFTHKPTEGTRARGKQSAGREGGDLIAMVVDLRRALEANPNLRLDVTTYSEHSAEHDAALEGLAEWLGGEYPSAPGLRRGRRALSNAAAIALVGNDYSE